VEQRNNLQNLSFVIGGAAVTLVLLVAAGNLGVAGIMLNLFIAVPIAYVHMRSGTAAAAGAVALVAVGGYLFNGLPGFLAYLLQFGIVAIILPGLLRRGWPWDRAVAVSVAVIALGSILTLAAYASTTGNTVAAMVDVFAKAEAEQAMTIYAAADLTPEQMEELKGAVEKMADFLRYAYAGLAITITGFLALLILWMLNALSRGNYLVPGEEFASWKASEFLVWPLIAAGFVFALAEGELHKISTNLLIILLPVYFLQGLAIVTHFFNRRQIPPIMRGLGYALIAFMNPMPIIITGIGVFDLWIDFRKPRVKTT
jgi:uncharacterized protein YybS (DUF2232 family)